jgi:hypothetical protein
VGSEEAQVEEKTEVDKFLDFHMAFCLEALRLCAKKNHDYAGAGGHTPFRNFETVEFLGLSTTETGILIRMSDKLNRMVTFAKDGKLEVPSESAKDALLDIVNYSVLLAAYIERGRDAGPE